MRLMKTHGACSVSCSPPDRGAGPISRPGGPPARPREDVGRNAEPTSFEVQFRQEDQVVLLIWRGKTSNYDVRLATQKSHEISKAHRCHSILVDARELEPMMSIYEIYDLPKFYEASGVPRTTRIAVLAPAKETILRDLLFYETVCQNNGFSVRTFHDRESAHRWLRE